MHVASSPVVFLVLLLLMLVDPCSVTLAIHITLQYYTSVSPLQLFLDFSFVLQPQGWKYGNTFNLFDSSYTCFSNWFYWVVISDENHMQTQSSMQLCSHTLWCFLATAASQVAHCSAALCLFFFFTILLKMKIISRAAFYNNTNRILRKWSDLS